MTEFDKTSAAYWHAKRVEYAYKFAVRQLRRRIAAARIPFRPGGRRWRSALSLRALDRLQAGTLQYRYRGLPMLKSPFEVALYQELLWEAAPRTVIEIGSYLGTSALWFADMLALRGEAGLVVSIDVNPPEPSFTRADIRFLRGDARRLGDVLPPALIANLRRPLLVVEDASHRPDSTLAVLRFFDPILQPGEYIIVEDALVTDLGAAHRFAGGPGLGISQFLAERATRYEIDTRYCDRFGHNVTGNPNGYLRRV